MARPTEASRGDLLDIINVIQEHHGNAVVDAIERVIPDRYVRHALVLELESRGDVTPVTD